MNLSQLIADYIHSQWVNFQRSLNEPQSRQELLSGAGAHFTERGTTKPVATFMDPECFIPHPNPVIANMCGEFPPIYLDVSKETSMAIHSMRGETIFSVEDARAYCV